VSVQAMADKDKSENLCCKSRENRKPGTEKSGKNKVIHGFSDFLAFDFSLCTLSVSVVNWLCFFAGG
jgi:hypothetical protein